MVKVDRKPDPHPVPYYDLDTLYLQLAGGNIGANASDFLEALGFELGSNANGRYIKFPEIGGVGWMICTHTHSLDPSNITSAVGNVFRQTTAFTWTFPHAFVDTTTAVLVSPLSTFIWGQSGTPTTTAAPVHLVSAVSTTGAVNVNLQATGRWS